MPFLVLIGAVGTGLACGVLLLGGLLLALRLLGRGGERDALALAVASLLATLGEAVAIALLLGFLGWLRFGLAFGLAVAIALVLLIDRRRRGRGSLAPVVQRLFGAAWRRGREHPALALIASQALLVQALAGLTRPPLSWDSLTYHLYLAARWLQDGRLTPVLGTSPLDFLAYAPANGSLWTWWWLAPSHSELWVNLAGFLPLVLLALATGAVARRLGARRSWPLAAFAILLVPVVLRFAETQYVDVPLAAAIVSAAFFGLRWRSSGAWGDALLTGAGLGLAAGTKTLGLGYAAGLGLALLVSTRPTRRRILAMGPAVLLALALGAPFYLRNVALGAGPFAARCLTVFEAASTSGGDLLPLRGETVLGNPGRLRERGVLAETFLGTQTPRSRELGLGPQALLLIVAACLLPFGWPPGQRAPALVVWSQVATQGLLWVTVPPVLHGAIFANVRYLDGAVALLFAAGCARLERAGLAPRWISLLALVLAIQDLFLLRPDLPLASRWILGGADLALLAVLMPRWRRLARRHARLLAGAVVLLGLVAVPRWASFRLADRTRAFVHESAVHTTLAPLFAPAWGWLDEHDAGGAVDVVTAPRTDFVYPAMGPFLTRRALYVNIDRANHPLASDYPACDPRRDPSPDAWLDHVSAQGIRWLLVARVPGFDFPLEDVWAANHPDRFELRYDDPRSRIYEVVGPVAERTGDPP